MYLNPRQIVENNDEDICIYARHITERTFPYTSDWTLYSWHNAERMWITNRGNNFSNIPKDGDICKICGREILIVDD